MTDDPVVVVPGDLDVEDRLAGPVTFRMAGWLAASAGGIAIIATSDGTPWRVVLGLAVAGVGVAGAWWRPGGRPAAAWIAPLLAYRNRRNGTPKAAAEDGPPATPEPSIGGAGCSRVPRMSRRRAAVAAATVTVLASAIVAGSAFLSDRREDPPPPVAEPVDPATTPPPVVVVVPVDPLLPWEVGGEVPGFDCGC